MSSTDFQFCGQLYLTPSQVLLRLQNDKLHPVDHVIVMAMGQAPMDQQVIQAAWQEYPTALQEIMLNVFGAEAMGAFVDQLRKKRDVVFHVPAMQYAFLWHSFATQPLMFLGRGFVYGAELLFQAVRNKIVTLLAE